MKEPTELMAATVREYIEVAQSNDPARFCGFLLGTVANIIGPLPDDYFARMTTVEPCGRVGCDCHLDLMPAGAKFLNVLRADWQKNKVETATFE